MPLPIFGYWDIRGLAEPIRYLLHYKNVDFNDKRYDYSKADEWFNEKFTLGLDFPNLPYYIEGEVKLTHSITILRYLAQKYDMVGKNEKERLRASLAEQQINDFRTSLETWAYSEDFDKKRPEFEAKVRPQLKFVADFLADRKFLAGDDVTYVDFMAFDTIDFYTYVIPNVLDDFPTLKAYQERVKSLPSVLKYMQSSVYTRWPIFGAMAKFGSKNPEPKR